MNEQANNTEYKPREIVNQIKLSGWVDSKPEFSHTLYGEDFYLMTVSSERNSGVVDKLQVIVSNRLVSDIEYIDAESYVIITGDIRTYSKRENDKSRLSVSVFATELEVVDLIPMKDYDNVVLVGYLCKKPNYRDTPLGRTICDMIVAVNRRTNKSDYIPCIAWGRNAKYASTLSVGAKVKLTGRLQSRVYTKKLSEETTEERTAYELSVNTIEEVQE